MPFSTETNTTRKNVPATPETKTLSQGTIEVIDDNYIKLLEQKAYEYRGANSLEDKEGKKGQMNCLREYITILQQKQLLLVFSNGRFEIDTRSLPPSVLPDAFKKSLENTLDILYDKNNPIAFADRATPELNLIDNSKSYNLNEEKVTSHIEQACVELLCYSDPNAHLLSNDFGDLHIDGDMRSGKGGQKLTLEGIKNAIENKPVKTLQEKQFLLAYEGVVKQGGKTFTDPNSKEKKQFDQDIKEKREFLDKSLKEVQEKLKLTTDTQNSTVSLGKDVAKSLGINMGNMLPVNKNPAEWSWEDAKNAAMNTLNASMQKGGNALYNATHPENWKMAMDHPLKIFSLVGLVASWFIPKDWFGGSLKNILKWNGLANLFSNFAFNGQNWWEAAGGALGKTTEHLMKEDPNNPLTKEQKEKLGAPVADVWINELNLPKEEAQALAYFADVKIEDLSNSISFDEKNRDVVISKNMFSEDQQAVLKKLPNFDTDLGYRKMLKGIYTNHSTKIQALFPQYPVGEGIGMYKEEYVAMKYLLFRYNHAFRKGPEKQSDQLAKYDKTSSLRSILEYEFTDDTNEYKKPVENEFYAKFHVGNV